MISREILERSILMFGLVFDLLELIFNLNRSQKVTEDDIRDNLQFLKKQTWFQDYLIDDRTRYLIVHDQDIRDLIGKCRLKRMTGQLYEQRFEKKFSRLITSKLPA